MKKIFTEKAPAAVGPYSQAAVINGMVYTSGQIAIDPATGELLQIMHSQQKCYYLQDYTRFHHTEY